MREVSFTVSVVGSVRAVGGSAGLRAGQRSRRNFPHRIAARCNRYRRRSVAAGLDDTPNACGV